MGKIIEKYTKNLPAFAHLFAGVEPVSMVERDKVLNNTKEGIYVLNNNYLTIGDRVEKSIAVISALEGSEQINIVVPATWVPINILDRASRATVVGNRHFRQLLSNGKLFLLKPEDAIKILEDEMAQIEYERAMRSIEIRQHDPDENDDLKKRGSRDHERELEEIEFDNVNPKVTDLVGREDITVIDVRSFLMNERMNLKLIDIKFLRRYLPPNIAQNAALVSQLTNLAGELELANPS